MKKKKALCFTVSASDKAAGPRGENWLWVRDIAGLHSETGGGGEVRGRRKGRGRAASQLIRGPERNRMDKKTHVLRILSL